VQGRWRTSEAAGTFAHRAPDEWVTLDLDGRLSDGYDARQSLRPQFARGGWCTAAGPVREVRHDGRRAWQVDLVPPPRKQGRLTLTVDDATGLLVRQEHESGRHLVELSALVVDAPVDDAVFAPQAERDREAARDAARYDLAHRRPVPTPQWFPWRRGWFDAPELRVVETDRGTGSVGRAPLGQEAPVSEWSEPAHVHRLDHGRWSWAVSGEQPMTAQDARRVVEQVVDVPPDRP
jgi:hypothetical protein